ncbi:hypothetical protein [Streptomyces sp. C10-9-1]|uniref:hypothetical protein n=1 Tax=Streptomyces sp. C10-9-1 TaxID=1859285 RepID=UPI003F4A4666
MMSLDARVEACTRAAEAHALTREWPDAVHQTVRSLIDRLAVDQGLTAPGLSAHVPAAEAALDTLGTLDDWDVNIVGAVHERLLELTPVTQADGTVTATRKGLGRRDAFGSWYTPPEVAADMCRLAIGPQFDRLSKEPDPEAMLSILAIDPACGAGVLLVAAARLIAAQYAARLCGMPAAPEILVRAAMPEVMRECVFGIDVDPVAVDLAKTTLWLEIGGREPWTFMDRNVIVGNALELDQPPAYTERAGDPPTAEERRQAVMAAPL